MDLTLIYTAKKNTNTLQVVERTPTGELFSLLELSENAHNISKNNRFLTRSDFTLEGIGLSLRFGSVEHTMPTNNVNKFAIEVIRNNVHEHFMVSIKPETSFFKVEASNAVHAFITSLQVMFDNQPMETLRNIFRPTWDSSILGAVHIFIGESLQPWSTEIVSSSTKK